MKTAATIETRKEIVAVLDSINNKINNEMSYSGDKCESSHMTTFLSVRSYYMRKLLTMSKEVSSRIM